jgi:DNA adenine methylase Dam
MQTDLYGNRREHNFIKSPLNYVGGKYKLLQELLPLFPQWINTFVDVFGGGFNVGINISANKIIYNDQLTPLVELLSYLNNNRMSECLNYIEYTIKTYNLNKEDKNSFNSFRDYYNSSPNKNPLDLYILICFSFNYQMRFNNKGDYNSSHGTNRSSFTRNMKQNLIKFMERLQENNIEFYNLDFRKFNYLDYSSNDFFYFDPPYIISTGVYNDGNRGFKNWTLKEEQDLYKLLDNLTICGLKWGLSNVFVHDGKENTVLKEWVDSNSYNVHIIGSDYSNSSYQKINRSKENVEVYITNI